VRVAPVSAQSDRQLRVASRVRTRSGRSLFSHVLDGASRSHSTPARGLHTVQRGETLWGICAADLKRSGDQTTPQAIYKAVKLVAEANAMVNPDLILVGQIIDLSPLGHDAPGGSTGVSPSPKVAQADSLCHTRRNTDLAELVRTILAPKSGAMHRAESENPWSRILEEPAWVSSEFGFRKDPFTGRRQHHNGIDLAVATGSRIYPLKAGRVVFSGRQGGYGNVVIVRHDDGMETVYGHNKTNFARVGQRVTQATPLGLSGSTGRSTGPHLHLEVRVDGRAVNPRPFLEYTSLQVAKAL